MDKLHGCNIYYLINYENRKNATLELRVRTNIYLLTKTREKPGGLAKSAPDPHPTLTQPGPSRPIGNPRTQPRDEVTAIL